MVELESKIRKREIETEKKNKEIEKREVEISRKKELEKRKEIEERCCGNHLSQEQMITQGVNLLVEVSSGEFTRELDKEPLLN